MKGKFLDQCPFCSGHGCFSIDEAKGLYHCFQCTIATAGGPVGGDSLTFLKNKYKLTDFDMLKLAAERAGITLKGSKSPKNSAGLELTVRETLFIEAAKYYHSHMLENGGKEYLLTKRGHKEETLKAMQVGYSDGGLVDHLRSKGFRDEQIKASGLAKEFKHNDKQTIRDTIPKGCITFPHFLRNTVQHITFKDPAKIHVFQIKKEFWGKDWRFYNQDALSKYSEVILVEGENKVVCIVCSGEPGVLATIGQPAEYQIKALQTHCSHKKLYLWMDNDEAGRRFIRQICELIKINVLVMTHPSPVEGQPGYLKDPDDYLLTLPEAGRGKDIKRLKEEALPYVAWEIKETAKLVTLDERLKALKDRKIFATIADMVQSEKEVYIEKLVTTLGFSKEAIELELEVNQDLKRELAIYLERVPKKDADPNYIAGVLYKHLSQNGIFYHDRQAETYLIYQHRTYQIGNNTPFKALMKKLTGPGPATLLFTKEPGRSVFESLMCEAYSSGKQLDRVSWIHTDRVTDTVYANLNSPNRKILKISKNGIEEIENGLNADGVLLGESTKMLPINFLPDADIQEGMTALKELVFDWMTCEVEQRYLVLCWFISAFLLDFSPYMALMKFSGAYESGKSTPSKFFSLIMYGEEHLSDISTAGAYSSSAANPLLILDDLESEDITKSLSKFLRLAATKGEKEKRAYGSDRNTIEEKPKGLICLTSIDPLLQTAVISRTFDIEFSYKFLKEGFVEDEIKREIVQKRDLIVSSILKLISKEILPNMKERKDYITILRKDHAKHAKRRMDEYLSLLMLTLNKLIEYIPLHDEDSFFDGIESGDVGVRNAWIEYQNIRAKENETSSHSIIKLLDGLVREYMAKMKDLTPTQHASYIDDWGPTDVFVYTHQDYLIELIKMKPETIIDEDTKEPYTRTYIEFVATSAEVVGAIDRYCKNNGLPNPYKEVGVFAQRLKSDKHILQKAGWELVIDPKKPENEPYFRVIRGARYYKFRRAIIR